MTEQHFKYKKLMEKIYEDGREAMNNDKVKKIFSCHKGGQTRKINSGKAKVTLPKLKFLEEKDEN